MKPVQFKQRNARGDDDQHERSAAALTIAICFDLVQHAIYFVLLLLLSCEPVFAAAHAVGFAVTVVVYAVFRRGYISEGAVLLLMLCEAGLLACAWMVMFGFPVLVYCNVVLFIIPGGVMGAIGTKSFRALQIIAGVFTAALIVAGFTVEPIAAGGDMRIYAAITLAALSLMRTADAIVSKKQVSRNLASFEKRIAGARDESMRDSLTGLWNRRYLDYSAQNYEFMSGTAPCTAAMLDLDHFKNVNDTYSHMVGDQLLLYFSTFLKKNLRASDHIVRWGGEEFLIIFTNTDAAQTCAVLNNLREDFKAAPMPLGESFIPMTFTAGLCQLKSGMTMQSAIEAADLLLYAGKAAGRDRVVAG